MILYILPFMSVQSGITKEPIDDDDDDAIISSINQVDWEFIFFNKNVHQQVYIFNKTISSQILFQINMSPLIIMILLG